MSLPTTPRLTSPTVKGRSMSGSPSNSTTQTERLIPKSLHEWTWKKLAGIKLLESTLAQQKLARRARLNERLVHVQQDIYAKKMGVTPTENSAGEEKDGVLQVGDNEIHYHYEAGQTPTSPPATTTPTPTTPESSSGFTWGKAGLLAAALLAGTGLGAGIPWLAGAYDKSSSSSTTTINNPSDDQGLGIEVVPGGALK